MHNSTGYLNLMLFLLPTPAALLLPATQPCPVATHKKYAQNHCPPCQLGKRPSSRISTDILALRAQNLQQPRSLCQSQTQISPWSKTQSSPSQKILLPSRMNDPQNILLHSLMPPSPPSHLPHQPPYPYIYFSLIVLSFT